MPWRPVKGFEGRYEVSETGLVRNAKTGYLLSPRQNSQGYLRVSLWVVGAGDVDHYIHRLVAAAFLENLGEKPHVNHKNKNVSDNRAANLEWVTRSENMLHGYSVLPRKTRQKPVRVGEKTYQSLTAAAEAHGRTAGALWSAIKNGRQFQGKEVSYV